MSKCCVLLDLLDLTVVSLQRQKGQQSTANQNRPESDQRQSKTSNTGPDEGTYEGTYEDTGEGDFEDAGEDPNEDTSEDPNEGATEDTGEGARKRSSHPATQGQVELRPIICSRILLKAVISPWMGHILLPLPKVERQKVEGMGAS